LELFEIVQAGDPLTFGLSLDQGGQEQGCEDRDDGTYDQQFDESESPRVLALTSRG
jgi:hypothetical protein